MLMRHFFSLVSIRDVYILLSTSLISVLLNNVSWYWFAERCSFFSRLVGSFICLFVFDSRFCFGTENRRPNKYTAERRKKLDQFSAALHWFNSKWTKKKINECWTVCLFLTNHSFILAFSSLKTFFLSFSLSFTSINVHKMRKQNESIHIEEKIRTCFR